MELLRDIVRAAAILREGGIVAYPTETFYALGALAASERAVARLVRAKLRPAGKPLPLIAADRGMADAVARLDEISDRLAARFWPGPLTLVVPAAPGLHDAITAGTGTVGIRVPGSDVSRTLARLAGGSLISTSANFSGGAAPSRASELAPDLTARIDAVLDAEQTPGGLPSTVVSVERGAVRLLRTGAIAWDEVLRAARPVEVHP